MRKTSTLDDWFGPKPERSNDLSARPTLFPHCEANIRDLCDAFARETEWHLDVYTRKTIMAGARDFYEAIGDRPDLLRDALRQMKRMTLSFSSPRSCITVARQIIDRNKPTSYIEGEYSDFIEH